MRMSYVQDPFGRAVRGGGSHSAWHHKTLSRLFLRSPRQSRLLISEPESTMNAFRRIKPWLTRSPAGNLKCSTCWEGVFIHCLNHWLDVDNWFRGRKQKFTRKYLKNFWKPQYYLHMKECIQLIHGAKTTLIRTFSLFNVRLYEVRNYERQNWLGRVRPFTNSIQKNKGRFGLPRPEVIYKQGFHSQCRWSNK